MEIKDCVLLHSNHRPGRLTTYVKGEAALFHLDEVLPCRKDEEAKRQKARRIAHLDGMH